MGGLCLFWNITQLTHCENYKKCGKKWMFLETSAMKSTIYFEMKEGCNMTYVKNVFLADLSGFISIYLKYITPHYEKSRKYGKRWMFQKTFVMESANIFLKWRRDIRSLVSKHWYFDNLLGVQYLLEILHTSPTVKTSKSVVESGYLWKRLWWGLLYFTEMKEGCSMT